MRSMHRPAALHLTVLVLAAALAPAASAGGRASVGYDSVRAAREQVLAHTTGVVGEEQGWTVVHERRGRETREWAFTPVAHPAHPAVVRRDFRLADGRPTLETRLLCEGGRRACETLYGALRQSAELVPVVTRR